MAGYTDRGRRLDSFKPLLYKFKRQSVNSWRRKTTFEKLRLFVIFAAALAVYVGIPIASFKANGDHWTLTGNDRLELNTFVFWGFSFLYFIALATVSSANIRGSRADAEQLLATPIPHGVVVFWVYLEAKLASYSYFLIVIGFSICLLTIIGLATNPILMALAAGATLSLVAYAFMTFPWVYYLSYQLREPRYVLGTIRAPKVRKNISWVGLIAFILTLFLAFSERWQVFLELESNPIIRICLFPAVLPAYLFKAIVEKSVDLALLTFVPSITLGFFGLAKCRQITEDMYDSIASSAAFLPEVVRPTGNESHLPNEAARRLAVTGIREK